MSLRERLFARTRGDTDGCLVWLGAKNSRGYGCIGVGGKKTDLVHRVAWKLDRGPIAPGMTIDHLCRNQLCVNVNHMEVVTVADNIRRGLSPTTSASAQTHCAHGHEFTPDNTFRSSHGFRQCKTCRARMERARYARRNERLGLPYKPRGERKKRPA